LTILSADEADYISAPPGRSNRLPRRQGMGAGARLPLLAAPGDSAVHQSEECLVTGVVFPPAGGTMATGSPDSHRKAFAPASGTALLLSLLLLSTDFPMCACVSSLSASPTRFTGRMLPPPDSHSIYSATSPGDTRCIDAWPPPCRVDLTYNSRRPCSV